MRDQSWTGYLFPWRCGISGSTTTAATPTASRTATCGTRRRDAGLAPGTCIVVGNEEADSAVAEIVRIDDDGVVLLRVLPGTVEDNRKLLRPLSNQS